MDVREKAEEVRKWDEARPGFKGEHWLVAGAGLLALRRAGRSRSFVGRMLGRVVGGALLARAASGRDGLFGTLARAGAASTPAGLFSKLHGQGDKAR